MLSVGGDRHSMLESPKPLTDVASALTKNLANTESAQTPCKNTQHWGRYWRNNKDPNLLCHTHVKEGHENKASHRTWRHAQSLLQWSMFQWFFRKLQRWMDYQATAALESSWNTSQSHWQPGCWAVEAVAQGSIQPSHITKPGPTGWGSSVGHKKSQENTREGPCKQRSCFFQSPETTQNLNGN